MKKLFFIFISLLALAFAKEKITITADSFKASENEKKSTFIGNVVIKKQDDVIKSKKAIIFFDNNNTPIKYQAIGDVDFSLHLKESTIFGKCEELIYTPKTKIYTLIKDVDINQEPNKRKIKANKVILDAKNEKIDIFGDKNKPAKFIFEVDDKE